MYIYLPILRPVMITTIILRGVYLTRLAWLRITVYSDLIELFLLVRRKLTLGWEECIA